MVVYTLLALSPLVLIVLLLLVWKRPLFVAAPITLFYTALLTRFVWKEETMFMLGASAKGVYTAIDILLIIFGAVFFLQFLKRTGLIESLESYLCSISPDHRIQTILLAWFFLSFIEGMSGFGTPMAIVAPLLVALGFPAMLAVTLALIGVGTSVAFGAVGTPIRVGLASQGLPVHAVPFYAALINMIAGIIVPVMLLTVLVHYSNKKRAGAIREMLPFALWSGVLLTVPYFLASFIGQEFPSLLGPFVGLVLITATTRLGLFVPKNTWRLTDSEFSQKPLGVMRTVLPYIIFIVLLLAGKLFLDYAKTITVAPGVTQKIVFFNPFIPFTLAVLAYVLVYRVPWATLGEAAQSAGALLWKPTIVIFCISTFVQLMIFSDHNSSGLPGMLALMTGWLVTPFLPFIAPFIGTLGAFISGSATVSNLLFANFQYKAATALGIDSQPILALQTIGGGVGNTVSLTDIVAVEATVGLHNEERSILKAVFLPVLLYVTLAGIIGMVILYVF